MRSFLALACLTACGGSPGPGPGRAIANAGAPARAPIPAPLYAGLFQDRATYRYQVDVARSYWDDQDPAADANGMVASKASSVITCRVSSVVRAAASVTADLVCDDDPTSTVPVGGAAVSGRYVATADGLYHDDELVIAAQPVADHQTTGSEDTGTTTIDLSPSGDGGWCRTQTWVAGDDGDRTVCFSGGRLVSGGASFGGGSSIEATYYLVP